MAEGWLPETGRILGLGVRSSDLPVGFDTSRLHAVQRLKPEAEALERAGVTTGAAPEGNYVAAIVRADRARDLSRDRLALARAAVPGGPILVDGGKTDGIESLLKAVRGRAEVSGVLSKAHGKAFLVTGGDFADWHDVPGPNEDGYVTAAGVFSAEKVDRGSALLAEHLPKGLSGAVADLGAGWGYLARQVLERPGVTSCDLVEADRVALDCARQNLDDARARFHWADATSWTADAPLDHVVCNPPFHASRRAEPDLGRAFIRSAAGNLAARGTLWLVANRHLPYEGALNELFGTITEIGGNAAFKIIEASRPRQHRR